MLYNKMCHFVLCRKETHGITMCRYSRNDGFIGAHLPYNVLAMILLVCRNIRAELLGQLILTVLRFMVL